MEINQSEVNRNESNPQGLHFENRLRAIYPDLNSQQTDRLIHQIGDELNQFNARNEDSSPDSEPAELWSEKDVVMITYADQISESETPTLETLRKFLEDFSVAEAINLVHLLPFYPYSSDDGFSVIDYYDLAPGIGSWEDVEQLNQSVDLMFDLVLNHCSKHNIWFKKFQLGDPNYIHYFHVVDQETDLSLVTRPRSLPLLTPFSTTEGTRYVWTTFSEDQVDLNFAEPAVLIEFIRILLFYVEQGARIIRLDAVAFLWKEIGTNCIHLSQTHEVVKFLRDILDRVAPHVVLLTETNVPHAENVSYFGKGDEAHMVYQFSLPPLILDTFIHQDAAPLRTWLSDLEPPPPGTTFFNFGASHDGIGVRPLEGLLDSERFESLVNEVRIRGGLVSTRRQPDGTDTPYELNISYFDAIVGTDESNPDLQVNKFLAAQSIILALPGIPGIYFHSLVGTPNDNEGVQTTGIPRRINRHKYGFEELSDILNDKRSVQARLFESYLNLIQIRTSHTAFHPAGDCQVMTASQTETLGDRRLLVFERTAPDQSEKIQVVVNPTADTITLNLTGSTRDIVNQRPVNNGFTLEPFGFLWLSLK